MHLQRLAGSTIENVTAESQRQPILTGDRIALRPWTAADAQEVCAACQDPEIQRWTPVPSPYQHADAVSYVNETAPKVWREGGALFAVVAIENGALVGSIGVHSFQDGVAHIGYWTAPAARRHGFTAEALRVLTRWFLRDREAARVELVTEPHNVGSRMVAEKVGFTTEGILRSRCLLRGRRTDVVMYSMLPTDPAATAL